MFLLSLKHKPWDNSSKLGLFRAVEFCMRCRLFMLTLQSFPWGVHQLGSFYPRPLPPLLGMQTYWCFITFGAEQKASCPNTTLLRATGWTESVLELLKLAAHRFWSKGWWPRGVVWGVKRAFILWPRGSIVHGCPLSVATIGLFGAVAPSPWQRSLTPGQSKHDSSLKYTGCCSTERRSDTDTERTLCHPGADWCRRLLGAGQPLGCPPASSIAADGASADALPFITFVDVGPST